MEGRRKKEEGRRKKEKGIIIPQTRNAQCFSAQFSIPNDQLSIPKTNRGCLAPPY
ncbi:hypothetical protein [Microcoleus sp. MON2_D5]|uniref:hypothetical protein n=1 Tax=Microcoleus sp. MON2_D5 TaxID=2818833 RepID=UPI002FD3BC15